ncbi:MAG: DUF1772 domain-containing protein, partial [Bacteroidota bacterium]|nr:DUF1772 domain-containing protein [Bacteroidota bacterium]
RKAIVFPAFTSSHINVLYGVFGVIIFGNVPLNNYLEKIKLLNETPAAISALRARFEDSWNFLNNFRTISSIISLILMLCTCILFKHKNP